MQLPFRYGGFLLLALTFNIISPVRPALADPPGNQSAHAKAATRPPSLPDGMDLWTSLLQKDVRLNRPLKLTAKGVTFRDFCAAMTKGSGVALRADEAIADRRVTLLTNEQTLSQTMTAAARISHLSWRAEPAAESGLSYVLFQTAEQKEREDALIAASEKREAKVYAEYEGKMMGKIALALAEKPKGESTLTGLLSLMSDDQRKQLATLSAMPWGIISSSSGVVLHSQLVGARPLSQLPESAQKILRDTLKLPDYISSPDGALQQPIGAEAEWEKTQFGFAAMGGNVYPAVVKPDGSDVWWFSQPGDFLAVPSLPDEMVENDFDSTVSERIAEGKLVNLTGLPTALRRETLRFTMKPGQSYLADALEQIARQTGIAFAADDFWRSRMAPPSAASVYLRRAAPYSLREVLEETARVFARRIRYRDGFLQLETLTLGGDLRAEPPISLLDSLRRHTDEGTPPDFSDYVALGGLSRLQFDTLLHNPPEKLPEPNILMMQTLYRPLHLYALLTPEQRIAAEAPEGLSFEKEAKPLKQVFLSVAGIGMPKPTEAGREYEPYRLYVTRKQMEEKRERLRFILTSPGKPVSVAVYDLSLPRP